MHSLCGDITYTATFMNNNIDGINPLADPIVDAVGYDASSRTFTVYSEDLTLIGAK